MVGHRYFDWELGRFITRDPSGYPDGPNNYLYCHNNPINFIDPLGLDDNDDEKQIQQYLEKTGQESGRSFFGTRIESGRIVETTTATGSLAQSAAGRAMAKGGELEQELAVPVSKTASELFVPGVGDVVDAKTGLDPKSSLLDKFISAGSLYLGVGPLPNVGPTVRRLKNAGGELLEKIVKKGAGKADDLAKTAVKSIKEQGDDVAEKLYRGVPGGNTEKAILGKQGVAKPRGTALDEGSLRKHVLGEDVNAGVTSWTTDKNVAKRFSGSEGTIIEVELKKVQDKIVTRPNVGKYLDEKEVLLKDVIEGTPTK